MGEGLLSEVEGMDEKLGEAKEIIEELKDASLLESIAYHNGEEIVKMHPIVWDMVVKLEKQNPLFFTKPGCRIEKFSWEDLSENVERVSVDVNVQKNSGYCLRDYLWGITLALYPVSVVKTRLQVATKEAVEKNAFSVIKGILRNNGIPGLLKDFGTVVIGAIPGRIIFLTTLDTTKTVAFKVVKPFRLFEPTQAALANGIAGMIRSLLSSLCLFQLTWYIVFLCV
ncbi:Solute carrier family 25 member 44 [Melia azedarach]|uniref:Solute carrier family 25 member 44 n=1 Tax=Melia azedarach TaxID=155640 RepID=A0ACC1Y684_MELAZ|nr:Solute carrier family 25 member 44 [Melia azedarach]